MGFTLSAQLLGDTYEAAWGGLGEWPPHPARLFCGLVAVAEPGSADDDALRWLEAQPAPTVIASGARLSGLEAFVPTNARAQSDGGHQTYPGRTSAGRQWPRALPDIPAVVMEWDGTPPEALAVQLEKLARRVPYLGRATSPVLLSAGGPGEAPGQERYSRAAGGDIRLRVPYPGYLAALRRAYEDGQPAWIAEQAVAYRRGEPPPEPEAEVEHTGAYHDMVILGFGRGQAIDGRHAVAVAGAFKAAVLERLGKPRSSDLWAAFSEEELALISGHHNKTARQSAVLALPFVGSQHATGELLGVALCPSPDLHPHVRSALLRLLGLGPDDRQRLHRLRIPGLGRSVDLGPPDGRWSLEAERWQGPARRWLSALPLVLDWWPRASRLPEDIIRRGCTVAGLPEPIAIDVLPTSAVTGTPLLRQMDTVRRPGEPRRPLAHVAMTFPTKVKGPVIVGHLRHLGLGLCVPDRERP